MELVVCDDGSSDDTVEIVRRFAAEAPFKVVLDAHGERLGFTPNFLRAVGQCAGEIVALCDQDDVWDEKKLAVCAAAFDDESVMTVTHRVRVVDENLKASSMVIPPESLRGRHTLFTLEPWFSPNGMQFLFRRAPIAPWLTGTPPLSLFAWFVTETFDEWIFHVGALLGTAVLLEDILGVWRRHGSTVTNNLADLAVSESGERDLGFALRAGAEPYEFRAKLADSRADFAARDVSLPDGTRVAAVAGAVEYFRGMSRMYHRRVLLHDPATGSFERMRTFAGMATQNDYRSRDRGGLGAKAAFKGRLHDLPRPTGGQRGQADRRARLAAFGSAAEDGENHPLSGCFCANEASGVSLFSSRGAQVYAQSRGGHRGRCPDSPGDTPCPGSPHVAIPAR